MPDFDDKDRLDLPPREAVEASLALDREDRGDLPGLHRMNTHDLPLARFLGVLVALAVAPIHNAVVLGDPRWGTVAFLGASLLAYALGSWAVLKRWFHRSRIHLGYVFVYTDLLMFAWIIHWTGGPASLYWPAFFIRIADQMWVSLEQTRRMVVLSTVIYTGLVLTWVFTGLPFEIPPELMKVFILGGVGICMILVARSPWDVHQRTTAARDLILQLEEQSVELDEARRRAQAASESKSAFLARMSHELRTPLNSVLGFTNVLIKKAPPESEKDRNYLERIRANSMHLLALINDLLDLARVEQGRLAIQTHSVDLPTLVRETVDQLGERASRRNVELVLEIPDAVDTIEADEIRMRQVLINLLGNALKFTDQGSVTVRVLTESDGRTPACLQVEDTGPGIPSERLDRIFEVFEQAEGGHSRKHGGTGLGLSISRSLCVLMGFYLTVDSVEGQGSTFTVWLRDRRRTPRPEEHEDPDPVPGEPTRVG